MRVRKPQGAAAEGASQRPGESGDMCWTDLGEWNSEVASWGQCNPLL